MKTMDVFLKDTRGAVMAAVALSLIGMVGSTGLAVDMGRAQLAQTKLSSALDAAGLAAGASLNTSDAQTEVQRYLDANFRDYMSATITDLDVTVDSSNTTITIAASGYIDTTFMNYFGFDHVPISASSEITRATTGLEVVLALDNTGSMAGTKLTALKSAASDLVEILHGGGNAENLYIGLVPFSQTVNIGTDKTSWVNAGSFNWGTTSWGGCVDARYTGNDVTDAPPSTEMFTKYYWPDDSNNDWISTRTRRGVTTTTYTIDSNHGPNLNCPSRLLEMTTDEQSVLDAIDAMVADGNTHVNLGAVWAWRMLSPRWRGLWGHEMDTYDLPLDYNTPKMNKAVVLMTDGENTMSNSSRSAYWYLSNGRLGTTNSTTAVTNLNTKLTTVCNAMKAQNIIVYTIAFGNPGTNIENLLRNCATQADYYFDSPTGEELQAAFRSIGDSLSNLRVSR
ncbi:MAG: VWA domain-containing protein [Alphaproteobacteria bacterium]|nr:VWA domain-containing protein [Alphaproteobacteria bacterium]